MDAFEAIVEGLFKQKGYWTRLSYKVNVTKQEKAAIGKPSLPRPEIDILAYKLREDGNLKNEVWWIECKSYLDSRGVALDAFVEGGRFKVFTDDTYRRIVSKSLVDQLVHEGLVLPNPTIKYCLVAGKLDGKSSDGVRSLFREKGWDLYDKQWIRGELQKLSEIGYENEIAVIVAKLLKDDKGK